MSEISDLNEVDASNTALSGIPVTNATLIAQLDDLVRAVLGMLKRWFRSDLFRLRDSADQTKLLAFGLSGLTTATTRTLTVQDKSGTIALTSDIGSSNSPGNFAFGTPTVSAGALTITIKGFDGNDPSASNPVTIPFRSATAGSGDIDVLTLTTATSLVISSGSTLGAPTGSVPFKVWIVGFNDAGTFRLGAILATTLASGALVQYPLGAWGIASSTAEGGAGAADSAQTFYTGTAVTAKAYTVLGSLAFESGLATAGTWNAAPTRVQVFDASVPLPGAPVQRLSTAFPLIATGTTAIPRDNTIPQITEGDQYMSLAITPSSASNMVRVDAAGFWAVQTNDNISMALFRAGSNDALAAATESPAGTNNITILSTSAIVLAASTASSTFSARAGGATAATITFNGLSGTQYFGGVANSYIRLEEIAS